MVYVLNPEVVSPVVSILRAAPDDDAHALVAGDGRLKLVFFLGNGKAALEVAFPVPAEIAPLKVVCGGALLRTLVVLHEEESDAPVVVKIPSESCLEIYGGWGAFKGTFDASPNGNWEVRPDRTVRIADGFPGERADYYLLSSGKWSARKGPGAIARIDQGLHDLVRALNPSQALVGGGWVGLSGKHGTLWLQNPGS